MVFVNKVKKNIGILAPISYNKLIELMSYFFFPYLVKWLTDKSALGLVYSQ